MRVGEGTRIANRERRPVDLVEELKNVVEAHGVTFVEPSDVGHENATQELSIPNGVRRQQPAPGRRRVSFDDARLDETWLSERSLAASPAPSPLRSRLFEQPAKRGRGLPNAWRARSISPQRHDSAHTTTSKHSQPIRRDAIAAAETRFKPDLLFDSSQTQLELNAEAFASTTAIRTSRELLHIWHNATMHQQLAREQAAQIAIAHDHRTLLKQALEQWREAYQSKQRQQRKWEHLQKLEDKAIQCRELFILTKAFTHWATSCQYEQLRTKVAQRYMLKVTYFKKWRHIASENQMKVRGLLGRKYVAIWREKTGRTLLWQEQASARYEETLIRRCKSLWFWRFCDRRVEGWHDQLVQKQALGRLEQSLEARKEQARTAREVQRVAALRHTLGALSERLRHQQQAAVTSQEHYNRVVRSRPLKALLAGCKLAPVCRSFVHRLDTSMQRKALTIWHMRSQLSLRAGEVDRRRLLQVSWTNWNDALRCTALSQKIDERVILENLYRWVLQERLALFQRTIDGRAVHKVLAWWSSKAQTGRDKLADAEVVFAERRRRRRLASGMRSLNLALRNREDAERAAVEFVNSRALPQVLEAWKEKEDHLRRLAKWATDARFYCLCTATLKIWRDKTGEHKQSRRRDAYMRIRAKLKIRLVGTCFGRWRNLTEGYRAMNGESERRAQGRLAEIGTRAFGRWRAAVDQCNQLLSQATQIDQQKLISSAFSAISMRHADMHAMEQQAAAFKREADLALVAGALRRVQWATFTATRKVESADALWARTRDQHIKHMLRHWATQVAARRAVAHADPTEVAGADAESPTLRPASRAASRSRDLAPASSPRTGNAVPSTPGYLRTPSRSRRAGRFRPLPTPAPFTPIAFEPAYLVTTPAPLAVTQQAGEDASFVGLTPQVTPFQRKMRAGGFEPSSGLPPMGSAFRSVLGVGASTNKSVRFAGASRFRTRGDAINERSSRMM